MGLLSSIGNVLTGSASGVIQGAIGGYAANKASNKATAAQLQAIQDAQGNLQYGNSKSDALLGTSAQAAADQQQGALGDIVNNNSPYLALGKQGALGLGDMANNGSLSNPEFKFDPSQVQNSPVFAQTMANALKALQRSAAGRGNLFSGGTAQSLTDYAKQISANDYNSEYQREFGLAQQQYNSGRQNVQDLYSRYMGLTDVGTAATARVGAAGEHAADQQQAANTNTLDTMATNNNNLSSNLANLNLARGNVQASGYLQRAGILNQAIGNTTNSAGQLFTSLGQMRGN